jgi:phenylalanyl-tRNA synthetase beta chain
MVKSMGIEGKIYGGLFAILPEKVTAESTRLRYTPFGLFPAALRDLALVVEAHTPADEVRKQLAKIARAAVGNVFALENVQIFDVYQGKGLPEGKKSLAFSLVFRAADRTLKDDEVNAVFLKIQDEIAKAGTYQIRK